MKEVIDREFINIITSHTNNTQSSSFTKNINLSFYPDEVIIKNVFMIFKNTSSTDKNAILKCDRLKGDLIIFPTATVNVYLATTYTENHFLINPSKNLNGEWTFKITKSDGNLAQIYGDLFFTLEFIKYS